MVVRGRCFALLKMAGASSKDVVLDTDFATIALDRMVQFLGSRGVEKLSTERLKRSTLFRSFVDNCGEVQAWLVDNKLSRNQMRAFLTLCIELLYDSLCQGVPVRWDQEEGRLIRAPLPVGSRELMIFFPMIPAVIEQAFPGYAMRALLSMVVGKHKYEGPKGEHPDE